MTLNRLEPKLGIDQNKVLMGKFASFEKLITELEKREAPKVVEDEINKHINAINAFSGTNKDLLKQVAKSQTSVLKLIEKELKLVTKNHYRNTWMLVGMSAFGLPVGVAIGFLVGNIGLLGVGLPIGMGIGVVVGPSLDNKARQSGQQLDVEMK